MTSAKDNPWDRTWTIVRSDLDIAHVMLPLNNFKLQGITAGKPGYQLVHSNQPPVPNCFDCALLTQIGADEPTFFEITGLEQLPPYSQEMIGEYVKVSESMAFYLTQNPSVKRLEGVIRIPCHAHGATVRDDSLPGHSPMTVKTPVQFYQFPNAIAGGFSLLVVRAPLSPVCPTNGDGTAIGMGKE